ncbi:MAG: ergothioneine biosynthesis protein EgtB [Methyloceanibacter sp.]|uniref:ergothioneine biosynthesis protein EgtB n=1 Tax=Methyloceanibacter sp. TaxID=1965321 RepID=UPI003D6D7AA9
MSLSHSVLAEARRGTEPKSTSQHDRLMETRRLSLELAEPLSDEDQVVQAMDDASPTKWHLAHTTWFFEAFLLTRFLPDYRLFDETFEYCFNSYYESVGPRHPRPKRGLLTRPSANQVRAYRAHVDEALDRLVADSMPKEATELVELGINHEQQHQELLLTDILSLFASGPLKPAYRGSRPGVPAATPAPPTWSAFDGGIFAVGHNGDGFAYDNEGSRHEQLIRPFKLAGRCVTNEEWIAFIEDGGYRTPTLWLADGWATVNTNDWRGPLYVEEADGGFMQMSLLGFRPVDPAAPVTHVSYYEADAFARWSGYRLPTEFEWEVAAASVPVEGRTLGAGHLRPMPAKPGDGLQQMFGDVWEWTASAYLPYPGFKTAPGAVGEYNGKFMCNQFVLKGGSCATPEGHIRRTYRNFFYPHQRWQFTGLRLAADA